MVTRMSISAKATPPFRPVRVAVLTISDTRDEATDTSGRYLADEVVAAGHTLADKRIVRDEQRAIREVFVGYMADPEVEVVISTGGTGITGRDVTVDTLERLYTKHIVGIRRALPHAQLRRHRQLDHPEPAPRAGWPARPCFSPCPAPPERAAWAGRRS